MKPHIVEYQWIVKRKWTPKSMKELRRRIRRQYAQNNLTATHLDEIDRYKVEPHPF